MSKHYSTSASYYYHAVARSHAEKARLAEKLADLHDERSALSITLVEAGRNGDTVDASDRARFNALNDEINDLRAKLRS